MVKSKRNGRGFAAAEPGGVHQGGLGKSLAGELAKEQEALKLIQKGEPEKASSIYEALIAAGSTNHVVYGNLAALLLMKEQWDEAWALLKAALVFKPAYAEAHSNLGIVQRERGDMMAAINSFKSAIRIKPDFADAYSNLGATLKLIGDLDASCKALRMAIQLVPSHSDAHSHLAYNLLLAGNYQEGWEEHEWRFRQGSPVVLHAIPKSSLWQGDESLDGAQILLVSEQGLGDTLQFMRYALALRDRGASVSICAQAKLRPLIQASGIASSILSANQADHVNDGYWAPILSVPRYLGVTPANPIVCEPYIKTTDELKQKWARIFSTAQRPVIGLNWQGNPKIERGELRGRSFRLDMLAPLADVVSDATFLSLQKGPGSEQLDACSFRHRFISCQSQVDEAWCFLEAAAIIANCDLVITSDTSVAHLAGGMGVKTWLLLHKVPEWRWGLMGDRTFWYPSVRLFRQTEQGNWDEVVKRVSCELASCLASGGWPFGTRV